MTGSTIPQSTWTWLKGRDFKLNGDNSDHGLVWVALTGNDNAKPSPEAETRFKNPLPMVPKFPGSTSISPESNTHPSINKSFNVIAQSNSQSLSVTVRELKGSGTITIYDLFSRVVAEGKIENGIAQLPVSSKLSGNHIVNISSNEVKISKVVTLINP
jgi:hypothetical protein